MILWRELHPLIKEMVLDLEAFFQEGEGGRCYIEEGQEIILDSCHESIHAINEDIARAIRGFRRVGRACNKVGMRWEPSEEFQAGLKEIELKYLQYELELDSSPRGRVKRFLKNLPLFGRC